LVTGVALSADGRCGLSGSWDRTLRVWDTAADRREACQLRLSGGQGGTAC
jgi:WD40 repeat protein